MVDLSKVWNVQVPAAGAPAIHRCGVVGVYPRLPMEHAETLHSNDLSGQLSLPGR